MRRVDAARFNTNIAPGLEAQARDEGSRAKVPVWEQDVGKIQMRPRQQQVSTAEPLHIFGALPETIIEAALGQPSGSEVVARRALDH